ncbi:MAG: hypothetical protein CSB21_02540 [Deltaproteobacteria bacterium]|nr:MAG: hypothetical protein CSB21_02540 [Deltaproteobacteria bacterium]
MEIIGYAFLGIVAIIWFIAILYGVISAFPFGLIGIFAIIGLGLLFVKVIRDRIANDEDDYYSKNVDL